MSALAKTKAKGKATAPAKRARASRTASSTPPTVDWYFEKPGRWQQEFRALRKLVLASGLTEELKWGHPCYTLDGANVVLMHGFKNYCALLFMKGALLKDSDRLLVQQTENVKSARQIRFTKITEISKQARTLKAYLMDAIAVEKAGIKVTPRKTSDFAVPAELQKRLDKSAALREAFSALSPGRQRAYLLHFSGAKLAETRERRVERWVPRILEGKGLDD